jgi:hypothetical protein
MKAFCFQALFVTFSLFIAGSAAAADNNWNNNSGDGLWTTPGNWSLSHVCQASEKARTNSIPGPLISEGMAAVANWIACGDGGTGVLRMTGGILTVGTVQGDTWTILGYGNSDNGTFTMDGGTVNTADRVFVGFQGQGTLNMNGGTLNIGGTFGIAHDSAAAVGNVYLSGGTINCADFVMAAAGGTARMEISGGALVISGDKVDLINGYISSGKIVFTGTTGYLSVSHDDGADKTIVGVSVDLTKAGSPAPFNYAVDIAVNANLNWTAGTGALSHNIYFGTSNPPPFLDNQTGTIFDPGTLAYDTRYYWRIDEVTGSGVVTGDVWTFTTVSGLAQNPTPSDGAMNVPVNQILSWTAGPGAASHDLYFGTDAAGVAAAGRVAGDLDGNGWVDYCDLSILMNYWLTDPAGSEPYAGVNSDNIVDFGDYSLLASNWMAQASPYFMGNTAATNYVPDANFALNTTYYWRVDEISGDETRKGDIWSFTSSVSSNDYSLVGKIMCGYQGWFACPGDGSGRNWVHWSHTSSAFDYTTVKVDMWPDTTEYARKYQATGFTLGTPPYYVFSSYDANTTMVHFKWMRDYGIDGVFVQRFGSDFGAINFLNTVLSHCKTAANAYGRKYAVMYDLTGYTTSQLVNNIKTDWLNLENTLGITTDPLDDSYTRHNGKPVIAIYGIFGTGVGNYPDPALCAALIQWFKDRGFTVLIGVNNDWRTRTSDTNFQLCVSRADIIMPWNVGRYGNTSEVIDKADTLWTEDLNWCNANGKDYLICVFPGFSWHNMNPGDPFNAIPRMGGQFLWDQYYNAKRIGATMLYQAMFDEVDEGTAIFKISNNPPPPYNDKQFLTLQGLPSDEYLWLVGQGSRALRGEIPMTSSRPSRP